MYLNLSVRRTQKSYPLNLCANWRARRLLKHFWFLFTLLLPDLLAALQLVVFVLEGKSETKEQIKSQQFNLT